jgi:hypothetical protein
MTDIKSIPSVSVKYACNGNSTKANEMGMHVMQESAYTQRGEQYLLLKYPPTSGIGRHFKKNTERLEKLFELYTKMTAKTTPGKPRKTGK